LTMLADVRERHNGTRRSPWNEVECGDHYVRPMASWVLLEAAAGYQYDAVRGSLAFAPRINPDDFHSFFITGGGWGSFSQRVTGEIQEEIVTLAYGSLTVKVLHCQSQGIVKSASLSVGDRPVSAILSQADGTITLTLTEPVTLYPSQALTITLGYLDTRR